MHSVRDIVRDLASPKVLPALSQGLIIGVLLVVVEVSFASIVYSGPLAPLATRAAGMTIFGAMAMSLCTCLMSSFPSMISLPQDSPVAVLAGSGVAVAAALAGAAPETQFATVAVVMVLSALVTALAFLLVGRFRLSNLVRFLPFPVVGGFLAGSGIMLSISGLGVMTGQGLSLETLGAYASWPLARFWLPGVAYALVVFALMKLRPHFMILPVSFGLAMAAVHIGLFVFGLDPQAAREAGWLLGDLPAQGLWPAMYPADLAFVRWDAVLARVPDVLTIALLSLVGLLLNAGGVELGARQDVDMDRELMAGAAGNLLGGLGGAFAGFSTLSLSLLGPRTGTNTRLIPLFSALVCAAVLFLGAEALTYFPKCLLGGLVLLLGLFFLDDWVFGSWRRLTPVDYAIVLVIMATIAKAGFLQGVGLGLLLAVGIFVLRLSRVPVVEQELTGAEAASSRHRPVTDRALLRSRGEALRVLRLRGYVFFGSANSLAGRIGRLLRAEAPPRVLILDLADVEGFDISAVNAFQRLAQQFAAKDMVLALAAAPDALYGLLERNSSPEAMAAVRRFPGLDAALQWAEDRLLADEHAALERGEERRDALFSMAADDLDAHLEAMERFEALVERMGPYVRHLEFQDGETVYEQGEDPGGSYLVLLGSLGVTMRHGPGPASRIRSLGPGTVGAPLAAIRPSLSPGTARAEGRCLLALLPREGLERMEQADPQAALAFHKLVARALWKRVEGR